MIAHAQRLSSSLPLPSSSPSSSHFLDHSLETPSSSWSSPPESSDSDSDQSPDIKIEVVDDDIKEEAPAAVDEARAGVAGETKNVGIRFSPELRSI